MLKAGLVVKFSPGVGGCKQPANLTAEQAPRLHKVTPSVCND
jgi:hypothetical protein